MEKSEIKRVLLAPICFLVRSTEEERKVFADKKDGHFYTFKLASGQRFVGHVPDDEPAYTFRPIRNLVPDLQQIRWEKTSGIADLGYYRTICLFEGEVPEDEKAFYGEILSPKPVPAPFLTKLSAQHYSYHPMLERCIWFQSLNQQHVELQKSLLEIQKQQNALLIHENENNLIQQKLEERRQNG